MPLRWRWPILLGAVLVLALVAAAVWGGVAHAGFRAGLLWALAGCAVIGLLGLAAFAVWFYRAFVRLAPVRLQEGIYAVLGGGGNSMVVADGQQLLVIDTKFPPASRAFRRWIARSFGRDVTQVFNTHHHYDHTWGNPLYSNAQIVALRGVRGFMTRMDAEFWDGHVSALPSQEIESTPAELPVGATRLVVHQARPAHTQIDAWIVFPDAGVVFVADLLFHGHFPFFDLDREVGVDVLGIITMLRDIASRYPDSTVVGGHGPLATSADLLEYADYLQELFDRVKESFYRRLTENETVRQAGLPPSARRILPSRHGTVLPVWATWTTNVRCMFRHLSDRAVADQTNR